MSVATNKDVIKALGLDHIEGLMSVRLEIDWDARVPVVHAKIALYKTDESAHLKSPLPVDERYE